jgi:hypothetical protein
MSAERPTAERPELTRVPDTEQLPWLDDPAATVAFLGAEVGTEPRT